MKKKKILKKKLSWAWEIFSEYMKSKQNPSRRIIERRNKMK